MFIIYNYVLNLYILYSYIIILLFSYYILFFISYYIFLSIPLILPNPLLEYSIWYNNDSIRRYHPLQYEVADYDGDHSLLINGVLDCTGKRNSTNSKTEVIINPKSKSLSACNNWIGDTHFASSANSLLINDKIIITILVRWNANCGKILNDRSNPIFDNVIHSFPVSYTNNAIIILSGSHIGCGLGQLSDVDYKIIDITTKALFNNEQDIYDECRNFELEVRRLAKERYKSNSKSKKSNNNESNVRNYYSKIK